MATATKTEFKATLHGKAVIVTVEQRYKTEQFSSKSRNYVWYPTTEFVGEAPPFSVKGDDPAIDKRWRAYNKAELMVMRHILILAGFDDRDWKFSRKAGCFCGCSAGFIRTNYIANHFDYFISVELEG